jgi:hypothetical protein
VTAQKNWLHRSPYFKHEWPATSKRTRILRVYFAFFLFCFRSLQTQFCHSINDNRNRDGTEIYDDFEVPIDPAISQAEGQGYSYVLPTEPASHQLGDHQQIMHHRRLPTQDYRYILYYISFGGDALTYSRYSPGFYMWDGLPYHYNFRLLTDQETISCVVVPPLSKRCDTNPMPLQSRHQVFHSAGGMGPPQMHMQPTIIRCTHANVEQPADFYGSSTSPL